MPSIREISRQLAAERKARKRPLCHEAMFRGIPVSQLTDEERKEMREWFVAQVGSSIKAMDDHFVTLSSPSEKNAH